jgi:hypothetical protein
MALSLNTTYNAETELDEWFLIEKANEQQIQNLVNAHLTGTIPTGATTADKHSSNHIINDSSVTGTTQKDVNNNLATSIATKATTSDVVLKSDITVTVPPLTNKKIPAIYMPENIEASTAVEAERANVAVKDVNQKNIVDQYATKDELEVVKDLTYTESITYNELSALKLQGKLIPGRRYILRDYHTKYQQPTSNKIKICEYDVNTITSEQLATCYEPLLLTALSTTQFCVEAYSTVYKDDILVYDFDNNKCEDGSTQRNGFIKRRTNTLNTVSIPYDYRRILFARYLPDTSTFATWTSGAVAEKTIYIIESDLYYAYKNGTPTSKNDVGYFIKVYSNYSNYYLVGNTGMVFKQYLGTAMIKRSVNYKEFYTFNSIEQVAVDLSHNLKNIFIGDYSWDNVFIINNANISAYNTNISAYCVGNTFNGAVVNSKIADNCKNSYFGDLINSDIGSGFSKCFIGNCLVSLLHGKFDYNILDTVSSCIFNTDWVVETVIASNFYLNTINGRFGFNVISNDFTMNNINADFAYNKIGSNFKSNTILSGFIQNKDFNLYSELLNKSYSHTLQTRADGKLIATWLDSSNVPQYLTIT